MSDASARVVMITGGNSGIGFATARKLAVKGYHVIMASRNQQTSAQAIARIRADQPNASLESIPLDLASFASIRSTNSPEGENRKIVSPLSNCP